LIASGISDEFISTNRVCPPRYFNIFVIRVACDARTIRKRRITDENDYSEELDQLDGSGDNSDSEDDVKLVDEDEAFFDKSLKTGGVDLVNLRGETIGFKASNHWRQEFLKYWRFSLRKLHPKRRPVVDDATCVEFIEMMSEVRSATPPWLVLTRDERQVDILDDISDEQSQVVFRSRVEGVQSEIDANGDYVSQ
jgi:hypothetical protein